MSVHELVDVVVVVTCSCGAQITADCEGEALAHFVEHVGSEPVDVISEATT